MSTVPSDCTHQAYSPWWPVYRKFPLVRVALIRVVIIGPALPFHLCLLPRMRRCLNFQPVTINEKKFGKMKGYSGGLRPILKSVLDEQFHFHLISFHLWMLVVKPRTLRRANLITVLAKNSMERTQRGKLQFKMSEENPRELFQGKPMQSDQGQKTQST